MGRQVLSFSQEFLRLNLDLQAAGRTYGDAYIERWASIYEANPALRLLGCPFIVFLAQPVAWLMFIGNPVRLRAAADCTRRAEAAIAAAERTEGHGENGRLVEKTRHHAYPRRGMRDFAPLRDA